MRYLIIAASVAIALAGSGCSHDCEPADGYYRLELAEVSGDCGDLGSMVGDWCHECGIAAECRGYRRPTPDDCGVEMDMTCPRTTISGETVFVRMLGSVSQVDGVERLEGQLEITIANDGGAQLCSGVYDMTVSKL